MTALMIASRNGHVVVLDTLLKHGASVDYKKEVHIYYSQAVLREGGREFKLKVSLLYTLPVKILYSSYMPHFFFPKIIILCIYNYRVRVQLSSSCSEVMLIFIMQANATVLMMAIYHGLSGVVEALLRAKPDVNITATGVRLHHLSILDLEYSSTMYN